MIQEQQTERKKLDEWMESPEYQAKVGQRLTIHSACEESNESKVLAMTACRQDIFFFFENFLWTYDPREGMEPNHFPFILFDFQKDYISWLVARIKGQEDGLVEKSRDMGVTWVTMGMVYYSWLFEDIFTGTVGSRKEDFVDDKTIKSLFGVLDYFLTTTPTWMLPPGFTLNKHRSHMRLYNPMNQNIVMGESANKNFARGSRNTVIIYDEFAYFPDAEEAWLAGGDATRTRIAISTPAGENKFKRLRFSKKLPIKTLHWKLHPLKDEAWYEKEKGRRTEEEIARELDISYDLSVRGRVYPEWMYVAFQSFTYNEELPLYISMDFGLTDNTAIIWWQVDLAQDKVYILDCYTNHGKTISFYIPFFTGRVNADEEYMYSKKDLAVIRSHEGWKRAVFYGDPAGTSRNQVTNTSVIGELRKYKIHVVTNTKATEFEVRRTQTKLLLRKVVCNDNERTQYLSECIKNAKYPEQRDGNVISKSPVHNFTSHYRTAIEYFAVNYEWMGRGVRVMDTIVGQRKSDKKDLSTSQRLSSVTY